MAKGQRYQWTPDRHTMAVTLRNQGLSLEQIGNYIGTSKQNVYDYFVKMGIDTSRPKQNLKTNLTPAELNDIERKLEARTPSHLLAAEYSMSKASILRVIHKDPVLKSKLRKPGAERATAMDEEVLTIENYAKFNLPIDLIAFGIKRSPTFLREKLAADDENPWKTAYMTGRLSAHMASGLLLEKNINNSFASDREMSPVMMQAVKHWDNRMNNVGDRVQATVQSHTFSEVQLAEKAVWLSERQIALISAGKLDQTEILGKEKMTILAHARELEKIAEAEWQDMVR